jgi:hypothetical protein
LPIIGGSSGSRRGIATVDCERARLRELAGAVAVAVVLADDGEVRDDRDEDDTFALKSLGAQCAL